MEANDRFSTTPSERLLPGERRAQIVRAGAQLFWEKGYHGASMQDIGDHVGMLKGSLYAHVANKEEILLEVVSTTFRLLMEAVSPLLDLSLPAAERLRMGMRAHATMVFGDPAAASMFFHESRHLAGVPGLWVQDAQRRYLATWERLLQLGVDSGEFRPDLDVEATAMIALSIGSWAAQLPRGEDLDVSVLADRFCAILLRGCHTCERAGEQAADRGAVHVQRRD